MKIIAMLTAALLLTTSASAHDFWLNPSPFMMDAPGDTSLDIRIGHAQDRQNWPADPDRIISFRQYGPDGLTDLQALIGTGQKGVPLSMNDNGLYMLAIETTHAMSELPAEKFNAYVEEEGLSPIREARKSGDLLDTPGREIYSRRGKALIQVGKLPKTDPDYVTQPLGMTLEIVSLKNPYRVKPGEMMNFQINFRGAALKGAQVMLVSLDTMAGDIAQAITDEDGIVSFKRPSAGDWMVHTVWSDPVSNHPLADFDTTFSSLSFGF